MSFFRSSSSQSSSPSPSSNSLSADGRSPSPDQERQQSSAGAVDLTQRNDVKDVASTQPNGENHKDMLIHALLEERCLNEVRTAYRSTGQPIAETELKRKAHENYLALVQKLSHLGLAASGLEGQQHVATRQQYRNGLDLLSKADDATFANSLRPPARRFIENGSEEVDAVADFANNLQSIRNPTSIPPWIDGIFTPQAFLGISRYRQDFDEIGILGKGGYGIVYECRHKLDGVHYAIKKVPLSGSQQQRIAEKGQHELDSFLSEVKTLAQLDHPSIVRYYNGWLEHTTSAPASFAAIEPDTQAGADDTSADGFLGRVRTESDDLGDNILFEDSASHTTAGSLSMKAATAGGDAVALYRTASRGTVATVSDEDVESISRASEPSASLFADTDGIQFDISASQLVLHMQMALYPFSLTDYLSPPPPPPPPSSSASETRPRHCFHLQPSLRILLALLDGLSYLHRRGICHRDIKPGNIFLAPTNKHSEHLVHSTDCDECRKAGHPSAPHLQVRIGDFGLVTALTNDGADDVPAASAAVGTELYRPSLTGSTAFVTSRLDLYALGVVAFELLWPFGTRMERHHILNALKAGHFPEDFGEKVGDETGEIERCITEMLGSENIDVAEVRRRFESMLR